MQKTDPIILLVVALVALSVTAAFVLPSVATAAPRTTITVTSTGDGVATPGNCPGVACRLRDAIAAASWGDTINFNLPLPAVITLTNGSLVCSGIIINGPGAHNLTISGNKASRIFDTNGDVTINGLTLRDGYAGSSDGGAINNGGTLTITNSVIFTNTARSAGAIYNNFATLVIANSTISNNYATKDGGGVYNNGSSAVTIIVDSTISGNISIQVGGGLIAGGTVTVTNTTFSSNQTGDSGGAIYSVGKLTLEGTTLYGNKATAANAGGGGIYSMSILTMTLSNVTISNNSSDPSGTGWGGGILSVDTPSNLDNVTITGNRTGSNSGGGIRTTGSNSFNLKNSIIAGNSASYGGVECDAGIAVNSQDYNLIQGSCNISGVTTHNITGQDPKLSSLGYYGGPTPLHMLMLGSPAIDAGNPAAPGSGGDACLATDQRGVLRPVSTRCDIGAYEGIGMALFLPLVMK